MWKVLTVMFIGLLSMCAAVPILIDAHAQSPTPPRARLKPLMGAFVRGEFLDGTGRAQVRGQIDLNGESFQKMVVWGNRRECGVGTGQQTPDQQSVDVRWEIEGRVVHAVTEDQAVVDLRWTRTVAASDVLDGPHSFTEEHRVVLQHGEWVPLDVVRFAPGGDSDCRRFTVMLSYDLGSDLTVAEAVMRYDLWLVHRDSSGQLRTERLQETGPQDKEIDYVFRPILSETNEAVASSGKPIDVEISGTLRGRARPDGFIDLTVDTWRTMYERGALTSKSLWSALYEVRGDSILRSDTRGLVGNGGMKDMTVRHGETIEIALPPVTGELGSVNLSQLFAGQSTSIRLTTTRVR